MSDFQILLYGGSGRDNPSYRYRILNLIEQLEFAKIECKEILDLQSIRNFNFENKRVILILHRTPWDSEISSVIKFARKNNIVLVYDIDDYVFEPAIIHSIRGYELLSKEEKEEYENGVIRYRKLLVECDAAICSTKYLSDQIAELGIRSYLLRNSLSKEYMKISEENRRNRKSTESVRIGYFSGTYTHNYDFLECASALIEILSKYNNVKLEIVGQVDLPKTFDKFQNRIIRKKIVPWKSLPQLISEVDINLVPLEHENLFSQAKSEIKFLEAAAVGIPTIASATNVMKAVISDGENGFIASSQKEWEEKIRLLIEDKTLKKIGESALKTVLDKYVTEEQAKFIRFLLEQIWGDRESVSSLQNSHQSSTLEKWKTNSGQIPLLKIGIISGTPEPGQGGFRTIVRICHYLTNFGHKVTLYIDPGNKFTSENDIRQFLERHYGHVNYEVRYGHDFEKCDVLMATFWTTAYNAYNSNVAKTKIYLVQDFEPFFYEVGYEYVLAEKTYQLGLYHITSFPWLHHIINQRYNGKADYFLPPIDRSIYTKSENVKPRNKKQIVFYARPDQPRRCYTLGIQALDLVAQKIKDIEIILFGSNKIDSSKIPFKHVNKGSLPKLSDLAKLYQNSDIGMIFSTTNPSLLSFEMMACGLPVIDLDMEANRLNYGSSENAILCEPNPNVIASKIIDLLNNDQKRKQIAENGYFQSLRFPEEEGTVRQIENLIINEYFKIKNIPAFTKGENLPDIVVSEHDSNVNEILPYRIIKQSFISQSDGLYKISVFFGTYKRTNSCRITMTLQDNEGNKITSSTITAAEIQDNSWVSFNFPEILNSKSRLYYLLVSSNDAKPGNAVTIYKSNFVVKNCKLFINNAIQKGTINFQTFCKTLSERESLSVITSQQNYENESVDSLLEKFTKKIRDKETRYELMDEKIDSQEEVMTSLVDKIQELENYINNISESLTSTRLQLKKLDNTIYNFSQVWPVRIVVNVLRKFIKK